MRWVKIRSALAAAGVVAVGASATGCAPPPHTWSAELVSVNAAGTDSGDGGSGRNANTGSGGFPPGSSFVVSADGSTLAYLSYAADLGPTDPGPEYDDDVYVRDLDTGTTTLATPSAPGKTDDGDGTVRKMALSADGTKLAFTSASPQLVPVDTNDMADVFVRDLASGTTILVSANAAGTDSADRGANDFALSPDGTKVAFTSSATNLGPPNRGDTGQSDVYLRDLTTGRTTLLSAEPGGLDGLELSWQPVFSPLGDAVAFTSAARLGDDTRNGSDVFVHDLATHTNRAVSTSAPAPPGATTDPSYRARFPVFAPSGRAIAYQVEVVYVAGGTRYSYTDIDLVDLDTGAVELVSAHPVPTSTALDGDRTSHTPVFSPDGTQVVFESGASYFGPTDTNQADHYRRGDLYLRDLATDTTTLVSANTEGSDAIGGEDVTFSPDGELLAFSSIPVALGAAVRVHLVEPAANRRNLLQVGSVVPAAGSSWEANPTFLAGDDLRLALVAFNGDLGPTDTNADTDVYITTGTRPPT